MNSLATVPVAVPLRHVPAVDLDDAFSEGDTNDFAYQFSAEAIRAEMARNISNIEPSWSEPDMSALPENSFVEENDSVSTLDINGDGQHSLRSVSLSSTDSPSADSHAHPIDELFSQISLSESNSDHEHALQESLIMNNSGKSPRFSAAADSTIQNTQHSSDITAPMTTMIEDSVANSVHDVETTSSAPLQSPKSSLDSVKSAQPPPIPSPTRTPSPASPAPASSSAAPVASPLPRRLPAGPPSESSPSPGTNWNQRGRINGPSAFEKVRSKTRPIFLPPKPRDEDEKHLADWETMMERSRHAADKKRKALLERRRAREKQIEESMLIWEREVVPDWSVVFRRPALRNLWWKGIPTKLRAFMWERAVGNALALSKDHYRTCLARAKRALNSGVFPPLSLSDIEEDISTTLLSLHLFHHETGPLYDDLKEMLCAWVVSRSDEGLGYTPGAAKIAAMLLINMPVQQAFIVMRNLLERHCMRSFFGGDGTQHEVEGYYRIFDTLLADGMPKIYFNFKQHQISPSAYLADWIRPLFLDHLPFEACARIWDVLLLEGDAFLYRTALAILSVLESRLFYPDRRELLELLKGQNKAAIDIARRDGQPLDGAKYEIYGVNEETLWERIDVIEEWWKETTWQRLLQRELPDL